MSYNEHIIVLFILKRAKNGVVHKEEAMPAVRVHPHVFNSCSFYLFIIHGRGHPLIAGGDMDIQGLVFEASSFSQPTPLNYLLFIEYSRH
jgi:hypothetical protein